MRCDTADIASFSRAFFQQKQAADSPHGHISQKASYLSAAMPFCHSPAAMVAEFRLPVSCIETKEEAALYIVAQSDSQMTPMTIVGTTGPISAKLGAVNYSGRAGMQAQFFTISFPGAEQGSSHEATVLCNGFMHIKATAEVIGQPHSTMKQFVNEKVGTRLGQTSPRGTDILSKERGTYNMLDNRERWKILSKELAQKQELIHQVVNQTLEANKMVREKNLEINQLKNAITTLTEQADSVKKQLRMEEAIAKGF